LSLVVVVVVAVVVVVVVRGCEDDDDDDDNDDDEQQQRGSLVGETTTILRKKKQKKTNHHHHHPLGIASSVVDFRSRQSNLAILLFLDDWHNIVDRIEMEEQNFLLGSIEYQDRRESPWWWWGGVGVGREEKCGGCVETANDFLEVGILISYTAMDFGWSMFPFFSRYSTFFLLSVLM
jgi:hypothetical protein